MDLLTSLPWRPWRPRWSRWRLSPGPLPRPRRGVTSWVLDIVKMRIQAPLKSKPIHWHVWSCCIHVVPILPDGSSTATHSLCENKHLGFACTCSFICLVATSSAELKYLQMNQHFWLCSCIQCAVFWERKRHFQHFTTWFKMPSWHLLCWTHGLVADGFENL